MNLTAEFHCLQEAFMDRFDSLEDRMNLFERVITVRPVEAERTPG